MTGRRVFMDGSQRRDYAFASTLGAISLLVWTASRASARGLPYGGSSLLIGLGLLAGLKHPVPREGGAGPASRRWVSCRERPALTRVSILIQSLADWLGVRGPALAHEAAR